MAKETKKNKKEKNEKKTFAKDFKSELKKVIWPTPKQLFNNTSTVIMIVLLTAAIVFVLDFCFDKGYQFVIDKADSVVNKADENNTNSEEITSDDVIVTDESVNDESSDSIVVDTDTTSTDETPDETSEETTNVE